MTAVRQRLLNPTNFPELVVGVPSGSDKATLIAAFARRSKKIKADPNPPFSIEELTYALSELERVDSSEETELRFSLPANKNVFKAHASLSADGKRDSSAEALLQVDHQTVPEEDKTEFAFALLSSAIQAALNWEWDNASALAKKCLLISRQEELRDEALNVLAVVFASTNEGLKAIDALKKAVEGEWNLPLQTNLAILATALEPERAVAQMKFLIDGSESTALRVNAVLTAVRLWRDSQETITGSTDEEDFKPLPPDVLGSIVSLLADASIKESTFFQIGTFLARVAPTVLSDSKALTSGPHSSSVAARIVSKRITGLLEFLEALASESSKLPRDEFLWLHNEVDKHVSSISSMLFGEDIPQFAYVAAFSLLRSGLDCTTRERQILRLRLIQCLPQFLESGATPSDDFIKWLEEVYTQLRNNAEGEDKDFTEFITSMGEFAGNILGAMVHDGIVQGYNAIIRATAQVRQQMSGFFSRVSANRLAIRSLALKVASTVNETVPSLNRVVVFVSDDELRAGIQAMINGLNNAKLELAKYV